MPRTDYTRRSEKPPWDDELARFIPDYATLVKPLRDLTRQSVPWTWGKEQDDAFDKVKKALSHEKNLSYFDTDKDTELYVDASPSGLGAILTQKEENGTKNVIAYASRSLTDVETRYSQIEREALAIYWGLQHFHLYLYGSKFTVITDHLPLVSIFNKPNLKLPVRLEKWILKLQQYQYTVVYKPGNENPADYMSRHPLPTTSSDSHTAEEYVRYVITNAVPKSMTLSDLKEATLQDPTLQEAARLIQSGKWYMRKEAVGCNRAQLEALSKVKDELSTTPDRDLIMRKTRIVVPTDLQQQVIDIAHEGHQGIVKTKALIREKVWFPGIDTKTEETLGKCVACLATTKVPTATLLQPTEMPKQPWTHLSADFKGPLPNGDYLLVVIDDHTRYPIVEQTRSTSANAVIPILDKIFAMFGTPEVLNTDNGPPWNSEQMRNFAHHLGFKHRRIIPYWPQANGEAERFMRTLGKTLKTAAIEGKAWKQELHAMLRNYRATPHTSTGKPPASLLFSREMKIKLPNTKPFTANKEAIRKDNATKRKMKEYTDRKRKARPNNLRLGDTVLVRQPRQNTLTAAYDHQPYLITNKKGTLITANRDGKETTRHSTMFKKIPASIPEDNKTEASIPEDNKTEDPVEQRPEQHLTTETTSDYVTRSGRTVKPPERLNL
ncbi:NYNRIN [Branchiostoma lanceolatum]|uniref:Gypsy retrotransposon integrase-like protein 1 n=1 Tax=Branchiostoma lanceolatum TaxID=7740 RepID=A0A8K0EIZ0_BRALA|nr:NYNRIN [Branchiostoma lanceolatum]